MSNLDSGSVNSKPFGMLFNTLYPNGLIPAGSSDASISDFRLSTQNFIPIYFPTSLNVVLAMTFDSAGAMTITGTGVQDVFGFGQRQVMMGMKSKMRMFPDSTGVLKYEIQLTFMNSADVAVDGVFDSTFGLMEGGLGPENNGAFSNYIIGAGMWGLQSFTKILLKSARVSGSIPDNTYKFGTTQTMIAFDAGIIKPVLAGSTWLRITRQYSTLPNPYNLLRCNNLVEYSFNHTVWNTFDQSTGGEQSLQGWNLFHGTSWMVGLFSRYLPVCNYTINNFTLLQGFLSYLVE